jgi:glycosyltransferase involved in cell wall biosynthesis
MPSVDLMKRAVTVVIPVFNGARFIARSIQSALEQTHRPAEIIVVDDCSTDDTAAVLARFGPRIRAMTLACNGGVSHARNCGMRAAGGELVALLDADDIWHPAKLELQIAALQACPEAQFCCSDFLVLNKSLGRMVNHLSIFGKEGAAITGQPLAEPFSVLIQRNFVGTSSVMLTRALMETVGQFNTDYPQAEDYEYWLRCALRTPFLVLPQCLMEKTSHDANLTNNSLETFLCHELVLLTLAARGQIPPAGAVHLPDALAKVRYEIAHQWFNRGAVAHAFDYYARGLRSRWSPANIGLFAFLTAKKLVRLASFGRIRRRAGLPYQ